MDNSTKKQAKDLTQSFMKNGMISSRRNKLGNIVWPLHKKVFQGIMIASIALMIPSPLSALGFITGSFAAERLLSSHIKFLQNMTLANATKFGRKMTEQNVPQEVREAAIKQFLSKAGPMFTASQYIRNNPQMIDRLANGQPVPRLISLSDIVERKMNRSLRAAEQKGHNISFHERFQIYKDSFREFRQANQQPLVENNDFKQKLKGMSRTPYAQVPTTHKKIIAPTKAKVTVKPINPLNPKRIRRRSRG